MTRNLLLLLLFSNVGFAAGHTVRSNRFKERCFFDHNLGASKVTIYKYNSGYVPVTHCADYVQIEERHWDAQWLIEGRWRYKCGNGATMVWTDSRDSGGRKVSVGYTRPGGTEMFCDRRVD